MATGIITDRDYTENNFMLELSRVREKILTNFLKIIDSLKARENYLLRELDNIQVSYLSYLNKIRDFDEKKAELSKLQVFLDAIFKSSEVNSMNKKFVEEIKSELGSTVIPVEPKMFAFEFDSNEILAFINKLGKLVEIEFARIDYKKKILPQVSVCETGSGEKQLYWPRGVSVDTKTGNIYIVDRFSHCVKVFDRKGEHLFNFGNSEGEGKMNAPRGIVICGNRVLISRGCQLPQFPDNILHYTLSGKFESRIGTFGKGKLEFNCPCGLTIDVSNGDVYICDYFNNRIQILNHDFTFKAQFGRNCLKLPRDVKLSKEHIYVIDESNPCLHLFNYNLILQKSIISRGEGLQVENPYYLFIDCCSNILISDSFANSILIFSHQFQLLHKISSALTCPMGFTVDNQSRLIVTCVGLKCLYIF